jgi:hypothetical protein
MFDFQVFQVESKRESARFSMEREILNSRTQGKTNAWKNEDVSALRNGPTTTRLHQKKLIAPSGYIRFSSFLGWSKREITRFSMEREFLNSRTQGKRNARKSEDVSELRNGPTTTKLHQKKLKAPSCDVRFSSFLGWIEAGERKVFNGKRIFEF